mmetsp:Transcript_13935/g.23181  ORF Transcript_13935/g.23181 Transcript_13935/m.23181 type:complete len:94 (+) Transcript_13935:827-1108(+)
MTVNETAGTHITVKALIGAIHATGKIDSMTVVLVEAEVQAALGTILIVIVTQVAIEITATQPEIGKGTVLQLALLLTTLALATTTEDTNNRRW